jgi:hypothetical protein
LCRPPTNSRQLDRRCSMRGCILRHPSLSSQLTPLSPRFLVRQTVVRHQSRGDSALSISTTSSSPSV